MIYALDDTVAVRHLFAGWEETMITSCLQNVMGRIFVTDKVSPRSAAAGLGCFVFLAGEPDAELVGRKYADFAIMIPQSDAWERLIEENIPAARRVTRYATGKDTRFCAEKLAALSVLPDGYEMRRIDGELYDKCLDSPLTADFVASFDGKSAFLADGIGFVVLKDGKIVSGASSFSRYRDGIEIEVDTVPEERRKHLAAAVSARLILECIENGLYPSWDAQNRASLALAQKLGYEFSHEYIAYEVTL